MGRRAEGTLLQMYRGSNQWDRARALWLLARIPGRGARHLATASRDANPDIRIVALRATRRVGTDVLPLAEQLVRDSSPAVRREVALALRHHQSPRAAALWTELAQRHDGRDRWYLEALGISADRQWDRYFGAWADTVADGWNTPAGRDVVWRSRSARALPMLERLAVEGDGSTADRLRYFRALDFHQPEGRQRSLLALLATPAGATPELTPVILRQLDAKSAKDQPAVQSAVQRTMTATRGTTDYVQLVEKYDVQGEMEELVRLALAKPNETAGSEAARVALAWGGGPQFSRYVLGQDEGTARRALAVLGRNFNPRVDSIIVGVVTDTSRSLDLRRSAVQSMGNGGAGTQRLLRLVQAGQLPSDLKPAAAGVLFSANAEIRDSAAKHLTPPAATTLDGKTLPPLATLVTRSGDAAAGKGVYQRACAACHVAQGAGIDYGPGLTEIGSKLSKAGLYMAILDPSAGVAFGYEGYSIRTRDGQQLTGYIASETDQELVVKMAGGIERRVPTSSVTERKRMEGSLMPHGLERAMTEAELVHLVEYLSTLRRQPR
jgi:putative heme-binding domain-containing protein